MRKRQVDLKCEDHHRTLWVPEWIRKGHRVRFEDEEIFWDVIKVYEKVIGESDLWFSTFD
ncbi:MAG TPA: hypothetical protein VGK47_08850 [Nitrososphaeraceae archaeon]